MKKFTVLIRRNQDIWHRVNLLSEINHHIWAEGEHCSEVRLQEGAFASGARLHAEAENGIHLSKLKDMSPTPAITQTMHSHSNRQGTSEGQAKESKPKQEV